MVGLPEEIAAALARGATVVTGRPRAARALRQAVDRVNREAGLAGWEPARVLAWDAWTAGLWRRLVLRGAVGEMLLNRTQDMVLWREVIEADRELATLRGAGALAGLAAEAWGELARYRGVGRLRGSARNGDMEAFERWAEAFQERCRAGGYVAQARLEGMLVRAWRGDAGCLPEEKEILLVGFDRVLPGQRALLGELRCVVSESEVGGAAGVRGLVAAGDEGEEIEAAARWARDLLEERPVASVGVIVPGLRGSASLRAEIDRVFRAVLAPEMQGVRRGAMPYEFSTGVTLDRTAMGRVALAVLEWAEAGLALERVSELLRSRYFAGGGEVGARAEFDAYELRRRGMLRPEMSVDGIVRMVERSARRGGLGDLLAGLRRMQAAVERYLGEERAYAEWAEGMREILRAAGWATASGEDSEEFQTRERWESVLDEMATLDFAGGRVEYGRALEALRGIAEGTTFAPESRGAPVQVMGPEEASGSRFDAVWFLRAGDLSWPEAQGGSPLLAWPLRRELGMPGTDIAADSEQARRVTERIAASCGEIVFSYARRVGQEQERQRASAMLGGLGLEEVEFKAEARVGREVDLEVVEDGGRLAALPGGTVHGGVGVLKAQAACAFHAFAEYRLFATEIETRTLGMDASERGRAVHGMLEHFWSEVRTQVALKAMTAEERRAALGRAIETTLTGMRMEAGVGWDGAYLETQRERLMRLGMAWLVQEEGRAVPFTVARRESEERDVAVGPLRLTLRLDRVDATEEGAVLIDYKTGSVGASSWLTERPDEPQLPLYAALAGEMRLHAVAFGLVRAGDEMKLTGYATAPGTLKVAAMQTATLEEQVEAWRGVVVGLAEDFAGGDMRVSPKDYPGTCKYCAHRLICRLEVASLDAEDGEESGEEDRG